MKKSNKIRQLKLDLKIWKLLEWTISSLKEFQILTQAGKIILENASFIKSLSLQNSTISIYIEKNHIRY